MAKLLMMFLGSGDRAGQRMLYEEVVDHLVDRGVAGVTALPGFGAHGLLRAHDATGLESQERNLVTVIALDEESVFRELMPGLRAMAPRREIVMVDVEVMADPLVA